MDRKPTPQNGSLIYCHSILESAMRTIVRVNEFRRAIDHLYRLANQDFHGCIGPQEIANWKDSASRLLKEYQQYTCPRAKESDVASFDMSRAQLSARIETAASYIEHHKSSVKKAADLPKVEPTTQANVSEDERSDLKVHYLH
jgi:hypothetical protein